MNPNTQVQLSVGELKDILLRLAARRRRGSSCGDASGRARKDDPAAGLSLPTAAPVSPLHD